LSKDDDFLIGFESGFLVDLLLLEYLFSNDTFLRGGGGLDRVFGASKLVA